MDTAVEKEERRAQIESEFNGQRDRLEKEFISAKEAIEENYRSALAEINEYRRSALEEAGLNPDGSDPQHNDRTPPEYHQQPAQVLAS